MYRTTQLAIVALLVALAVTGCRPRLPVSPSSASRSVSTTIRIPDAPRPPQPVIRTNNQPIVIDNRGLGRAPSHSSPFDGVPFHSSPFPRSPLTGLPGHYDPFPHHGVFGGPAFGGFGHPMAGVGRSPLFAHRPVVIVRVPSTPAVNSPPPQPSLGSLARSLEQIGRNAARKDYKGVASASRDVLDLGKLPDVVTRPVQAARQCGVALDELTTLLNAVKAGQSAKRGAGQAHLPPSAAKGLDALAALDEAEKLLTKPWPKNANLALIEGALADVAAAPTTRSLAADLQRAVALRAADQGHPTIGAKLLPGGAAELRDLKAAAAKPATTPPAAGADAPLVPEGPASSYRPPTREAASAGLPAMVEKVAAAKKQARDRASNELAAEIDRFAGQLARHRQQIDDLARRAADLEKDGGEPAGTDDESLARALGRPLTASDRILAEQMRAKGRSKSEILAILREP